jgi:3-hydroxyisobutyrate dehydrogenase-like beta-hydroxyacid dehydrogenase
MSVGRIGFVGLGNIGAPMATRLTAWPGGLVVHDAVDDAVAPLVEAGAEPAASVAELAGTVDLLGVMVRDDEQVHAVLTEALTTARPGTVVAVHATVAPDTPARLASIAAPHDVQVVDAPVSGGPMGAADGRLAIMVGGSEDAFAVCAEPFALLAAKVVHAGPVGAGTRMKLARNLIHFAAFTAVTEAQRLAEAGGLDLVALGEIVRHTDAVTGGPGAIMYRDTTAPLTPDDGWHGIFEHVAALGEKDLRFAIDLADELHVEVPLARHALSGLAAGLGLPGHDEDHQEAHA